MPDFLFIKPSFLTERGFYAIEIFYTS